MVSTGDQKFVHPTSISVARLTVVAMHTLAVVTATKADSNSKKGLGFRDILHGVPYTELFGPDLSAADTMLCALAYNTVTKGRISYCYKSFLYDPSVSISFSILFAT